MAKSGALGGLQQQGPYQKGLPLKAGEALSLSYWLFPDPSLPPREFRVRAGHWCSGARWPAATALSSMHVVQQARWTGVCRHLSSSYGHQPIYEYA